MDPYIFLRQIEYRLLDCKNAAELLGVIADILQEPPDDVAEWIGFKNLRPVPCAPAASQVTIATPKLPVRGSRTPTNIFALEIMSGPPKPRLFPSVAERVLQTLSQEDHEQAEFRPIPASQLALVQQLASPCDRHVLDTDLDELQQQSHYFNLSELYTVMRHIKDSNSDYMDPVELPRICAALKIECPSGMKRKAVYSRITRRCRQLPQFFPHLQYYELPNVSYTILTSYPELLLFRHSAGLKRRIREATSDTNEQ